jgi:hypothetical protein
MAYSHRYVYRSLNTRVLIVASVSYFGTYVIDWAAYIGAVPGVNHDNEYKPVAESGSKADKPVAEHYFPQFKKYNYRN